MSVITAEIADIFSVPCWSSVFPIPVKCNIWRHSTPIFSMFSYRLYIQRSIRYPLGLCGCKFLRSTLFEYRLETFEILDGPVIRLLSTTDLQSLTKKALCAPVLETSPTWRREKENH